MRPPRLTSVRPRLGRSRGTAPIAPLDPAFNAVADLGERHPWLWLGMTPPDPRRPLPARAHAWIVVTSVAGAASVEAAQAATGTLSTGRTLAAERAVTALVLLAGWAVATGAWERRARRQRGVLDRLRR